MLYNQYILFQIVVSCQVGQCPSCITENLVKQNLIFLTFLNFASHMVQGLSLAVHRPYNYYSPLKNERT